MFSSIALSTLLSAIAVSPNPTLEPTTVQHVLDTATQKYQATAKTLSPENDPELIDAAGHWTTVPATAMTNWVQGFLPGILWRMSELTGDASWKTSAETFTSPLEIQKTNRATHDLGFKLNDSFGAAYRVTKDDHDRQVLLTAAASLASRFHQNPGVVSCCDWNPDWHLPMVSDTMMNIELLFWAAENGGDPAYRDMALSHALRNAQDIVRPDGSTFHIVDYDPNTGAILKRGTYQGYADDSTWSRGHVWEIYGFTVAYRYTHDARMLDAAKKTANYYLDHLPANGVPNWDFNAPSQHPDSSAAAAAASALLELATYVDGADATRYHDAAMTMLRTLTGPEFFDSSTDTDALLLHGTADLPRGKGIDTGLIYGDYYLLEALQRAQQTSTNSGSTTTDSGSTASTGPSTASGSAGNEAAPAAGGCASAGVGTLGLGALGAALFLRRRRQRA